VAQLLSHTAGIFRDGTDCAYWLDRAPFSDAQRIRADLALPPAIDANTRLKYSNHGFALAGLVIEAITGEPYATWVAREVVAPAGLRETTPDMPIAKSARFASGHSLRLPLGHRVIFPADGATHALAAATGFVSTAADLVRFFSQLAPTAAQSFLSPASRREMIRPHWREAHAAQQRAYGLGIISGSEDGWDWFGHSGGFQGTLTRTAVVPAQGLAVSVLTNAADGQSGVWLEGVLRILKTFAEGGAPTTTAADWAGRWWSVWGAFDLVPVGDKVLVGRPGLLHPLQHAAELAIEGPDRGRIALDGSFGSHGEPVRRVYGKSGAATELWLAGSKLVPEKVLAQELTRRYAKSPS
jgi:CubicO group peptidase (beta-lactamase class C family)